MTEAAVPFLKDAAPSDSPLLDGDELDQPDVGILGKKARAVDGKSCGYGPVQMSLPPLLGLEGVEDAEGVLIDPEGVPRLGVRLIGDNVSAPFEEVPYRLLISGPGLHQRQHSKLEVHRSLLEVVVGIGKVGGRGQSLRSLFRSEQGSDATWWAWMWNTASLPCSDRNNLLRLWPRPPTLPIPTTTSRRLR